MTRIKRPLLSCRLAKRPAKFEDWDYHHGVIFDPCRQYDYACCNNTFGEAEFVRMVQDPDSVTNGQQYFVDSRGQRMLPEHVYVDAVLSHAAAVPPRARLSSPHKSLRVLFVCFARTTSSIRDTCFNHHDASQSMHVHVALSSVVTFCHEEPADALLIQRHILPRSAKACSTRTNGALASF